MRCTQMKQRQKEMSLRIMWTAMATSLWLTIHILGCKNIDYESEYLVNEFTPSARGANPHATYCQDAWSEAQQCSSRPPADKRPRTWPARFRNRVNTIQCSNTSAQVYNYTRQCLSCIQTRQTAWQAETNGCVETNECRQKAKTIIAQRCTRRSSNCCLTRESEVIGSAECSNKQPQSPLS